ncbi:MAG: transposase [Chloroflexi bacterium]|nr:transposase [Chloroflexota bacterium]
MNYNIEQRRRRSIRLLGYDYAQTGGYFVTICTQGRACIFGDVVDGEMRLNHAGEMVQRWWTEMGNKFPAFQADEYVVMPNHFHAVVNLVSPKGAHAEAPLSTMVQWLKTMTTNEYIRCVKQCGWPPFSKRVWQRNYYEHIIRDESALGRIRRYIVDNPAKWHKDPENPLNARQRPT